MNETKTTIQLLNEAQQGHSDASEELFRRTYDELHRLAQNFFRTERVGHTLQPTALVHEAYLRLVDQKEARLEDRDHFLSVAATVMRRVLVDHARARNAQK